MKKAYATYQSSVNSASRRGIHFLLSFDEWYQWWLSNGVDKNGPSQKELGISRLDTLCMCRYGDVGPYSLENIYCASASQNSKDMTLNNSRYCPKRQISTPQGVFPSITNWAKNNKKNPSTFYILRNKYPDDYKYLDCRKNKPSLN